MMKDNEKTLFLKPFEVDALDKKTNRRDLIIGMVLSFILIAFGIVFAFISDSLERVRLLSEKLGNDNALIFWHSFCLVCVIVGIITLIVFIIRYKKRSEPGEIVERKIIEIKSNGTCVIEECSPWRPIVLNGSDYEPKVGNVVYCKKNKYLTYPIVLKEKREKRR